MTDINLQSKPVARCLHEQDQIMGHQEVQRNNRVDCCTLDTRAGAHDRQARRG